MLIVTWNVNSLRARIARLQELLAKHTPDVVLLQETKCSTENFPSAEIEAAGYTAVAHAGGQWAGVAILARTPLALTDPQYGLPGEPVPQEARWVEASVGGIRFVSTYVHNGRAVDHPEFANKLAFLQAAAMRAAAQTQTGAMQADGQTQTGAMQADGQTQTGTMRAAAKTQTGTPASTHTDTGTPDHLPLLIAGDFNIAPSDADAWDATQFETHVTTPERAALRELQDRGKLVDAYRQLHPDTPQFTWWDYRAGAFHKNLGLRIDLVLISNSEASRISECFIDRDMRKGEKPSDHAPLFLRLA